MNEVFNEFRSLPIISQPVIAELVRNGILGTALSNSSPFGDALKRIRGYAASDGWFEIDATADQHVAILVYDEIGMPLDIVAWNMSTNAVATFHGRAWAIGEPDILNSGSYFCGAGLRVHRTPLGWLQHNRNGIVILKPDRLFDAVRDLAAITCEDRAHRYELRRLLQPKHLPRILIRHSDRDVA